MAAGSRVPAGAANFDSWLRRCEGFRVDSPQGRVGFVEEVRYGSRLDRPDVLAVRAGRIGRLLLIVPVAEIAEISLREERIVLHRSPRPTATERPKDVGRHARPGGRRMAANRAVKGIAAGVKRIEAAQREVKAVIKRLTRLIGLRLGRGGEREMMTTTTTTTTPDVEASAEPPAEEPPAEEQAAEEPAAEEGPAEETAEAAPTEEPAAEEPPAEEAPPEEPPAEGRTTA
jgi:hypothetical protein